MIPSNTQSTATPPSYRGRFAPSPTGPLHFGSLVAAVGSYVQARSQHGQWLLRIEDLDVERNQNGASDSILRVLEAFGFEWDGDITYQSRRLDYYHDVLASLRANKYSYPCSCSRKTVRQAISETDLLVYPGTCRSKKFSSIISPNPGINNQHAIRLKVDSSQIDFEDELQGHYSQNLKTDVGDFILQRADGHIAYQLAVVVDDHLQGINQVVRGADLLDNTPRQIYLQQILNYTTPSYVHLPVATNAQGQKLSKQTGALAIDCNRANSLLCEAAAFLGHPIHSDLQHAPLSEIWHWLIERWQLKQVPPHN